MVAHGHYMYRIPSSLKSYTLLALEHVAAHYLGKFMLPLYSRLPTTTYMDVLI